MTQGFTEEEAEEEVVKGIDGTVQLTEQASPSGGIHKPIDPGEVSYRVVRHLCKYSLIHVCRY